MMRFVSHHKPLFYGLGLTLLAAGLAESWILLFRPDVASGDVRWSEIQLYFYPAAIIALVPLYHILVLLGRAIWALVTFLGRGLGIGLRWVLELLARVVIAVLIRPMAMLLRLIWRGLTIVLLHPLGIAARFVGRQLARFFALIGRALRALVFHPVAVAGRFIGTAAVTAVRFLGRAFNLLLIRPLAFIGRFLWAGIQALGRGIRLLFGALGSAIAAVGRLLGAGGRFIAHGLNVVLLRPIVRLGGYTLVGLTAVGHALGAALRFLGRGISRLLYYIIGVPLILIWRGLSVSISALARLPRQLTAPRLLLILGLGLMASLGVGIARSSKLSTFQLEAFNLRNAAATSRPALGFSVLIVLTTVYMVRRPLLRGIGAAFRGVGAALSAAFSFVIRVLNLLIYRPVRFILHAIASAIAAVGRALGLFIRYAIWNPLTWILRLVATIARAIGHALYIVVIRPLQFLGGLLVRGISALLKGLWIGFNYIVVRPLTFILRILKALVGLIFGLLARILRLVWAVISLLGARLATFVMRHPRLTTNAVIVALAAGGIWYLYSKSVFCASALELGCVPPAPPPPLCTKAGPPDALEICIVTAGTKADWIRDVTNTFNSQQHRTASGRVIWVKAEEADSGDFYPALQEGRIVEPTIWSPGEMGWVNDVNVTHVQLTGRPLITKSCPPTVYAVIGFGMWRSMAVAMGWPDKRIGWDDLVALAADPQGWGRYGHPEWGQFKFGHTHPGYSNTGFLAVTSLVYNTLDVTQGLKPEMVKSPKVIDAFRQLELQTDHYGMSTRSMFTLMATRGRDYLHAAANSESGVLMTNKYNKGMPEQVVLIIPSEGAYWSEQPICLIEADWVSAEQAEAAELYEQFLLTPVQQDRAMDFGLRPTVPGVPLRAPIDLSYGTDPRVTPENTPNLESVSGEVSQAIKDVFQQTKKKATVVVVLDTSGSMVGGKMTSAVDATVNFLKRLNKDDEVEIIAFNDTIQELQPFGRAADVTEELSAALRNLAPKGQTALYDAICAATARSRELSRLHEAQGEHRLYGIVVLSDGKDTSSKTTVNALYNCLPPTGAPLAPKLFTIAYGMDADKDLLSDLAKRADGRAFSGDPYTIDQVYLSISAEQ